MTKSSIEVLLPDCSLNYCAARSRVNYKSTLFAKYQLGEAFEAGSMSSFWFKLNVNVSVSFQRRITNLEKYHWFCWQSCHFGLIDIHDIALPRRTHCIGFFVCRSTRVLQEEAEKTHWAREDASFCTLTTRRCPDTHATRTVQNVQRENTHVHTFFDH